jgi:hypothetical protein
MIVAKLSTVRPSSRDTNSGMHISGARVDADRLLQRHIIGYVAPGLSRCSLRRRPRLRVFSTPCSVIPKPLAHEAAVDLGCTGQAQSPRVCIISCLSSSKETWQPKELKRWLTESQNDSELALNRPGSKSPCGPVTKWTGPATRMTLALVGDTGYAYIDDLKRHVTGM